MYFNESKFEARLNKLEKTAKMAKNRNKYVIDFLILLCIQNPSMKYHSYLIVRILEF